MLLVGIAKWEILKHKAVQIASAKGCATAIYLPRPSSYTLQVFAAGLAAADTGLARQKTLRQTAVFLRDG